MKKSRIRCLIIVSLICSFLLSACGNTADKEKDVMQGSELTEVGTKSGDGFEKYVSKSEHKVTDTDFVLGQDYQYMFVSNSRNPKIMMNKTENGYYIVLDNILYFADENLENVMPLCFKPACEHKKEYSCNAYLEGGEYVLYYDNILFSETRYNPASGKILFNDVDILKTTLDGSKKELLTIEDDFVFDVIIHRGYAYYLTNGYRIEGEAVTKEEAEAEQKKVDNDESEKEIIYYAILKRVSLKTGEVETLIDYEDYYLKLQSIEDMYAYQNYVYFLMDNGLGAEDERAIFILSLEEGKLTKLAIKGEYELGGSQLTFSEDRMLLKRIADNTVYSYKLDGTDEQVFMELDKVGVFVYADSRYLYTDNVPEILSAKYRGESATRAICYYDIKTKEYKGEVKLGDNTTAYSMAGGDEKYYYYLEEVNGIKRIMYFEKDKLETGNVELKKLCEY